MQVDVINIDGQPVGQIDLDEQIFGIEPNENAMHQAVVTYLAHQRQGTRSTKTRAEVRGGGKKPWRQKGRGTARAGSTRSPLWVGGGTIHGPRPFKYSPKITKKLRRLARNSALSLRRAEENIIIVDDFIMDEIKTKRMFQIMKNLNVDYETTLILLPKHDLNIYYSTKNIPGVSIYVADKISTYDILKHKKLLILKSALGLFKN